MTATKPQRQSGNAGAVRGRRALPFFAAALVALAVCALLRGDRYPVRGAPPLAAALEALSARSEAAWSVRFVPTLPPLPAFLLPQPYEFGVPLEEGEPAADDSVFENAVFLGDSRTEGLQLWGGIHGGRYYWARGMTVFRTDDPAYTFSVDGQKLTMVQALGQRQYDKVYIMIGVNELGWPADLFEEGLGTFLDKVIAAQPEAVVYLQTLPPLNDDMARKNLAYYENNQNVNAFNEIIVRQAAEKRVVLLDTAQAYRDETGQLPADWSVDGCHFTREGYQIWADYLRCHIMDPKRYFDSRETPETGEEP